MSYRFFLSHARRDADKYLARFHDQLAKLVAGLTNQWDHTAFRDIRDIERGDWWETALGTALSQSKVFVFLSSPSSLASPWCGKEWAGFARRCADYQNIRQRAVPPPLIFPIPWIPVQSMPGIVTALQSEHVPAGLEEATRICKEKGLLYLMKVKPKLYLKFLDQLATDIVAASQKAPLTNHPNPADFKTLESAFPPVAPDHVCARFIYVVPGSEEIRACRTRVDAYGADRKQWRPFYPPSDSDVATIAYRASQQENLNYEDAPLGDLEQQIRQATDDKRILVLLIDAWALKIAKYRIPMERYEEKRGDNCVLVVPWNLMDPETSANSTNLWNTIETTLRRATTADDQAADPGELQAKLVRKLIQGRKVLLETAQLRGGLPAANVPLAIVSAVKEAQ
jgi:FxsC-like protein